MGNWNMTIQGVGPHGNGIEADVEQIYKRFIEDLKTAGHNITHSSVTSGGAYFEPNTIPPVVEGPFIAIGKSEETVSRAEFEKLKYEMYAVKKFVGMIGNDDAETEVA